jgi:hypothetical protein
MAYENIRLRKPNVVMVDGYFWMVDEDTDSLVVKTDDGTLAYSYPLDSTITQTVKSLEYDGRNLWTLRATNTDEVTIDRWYINNYVCVRRNTFVFVPGGSHKFNVDTFTVEHYHTTFSANEEAGQSILSVIDGSKLESGYTVVLGPNVLVQIEERTVSSASEGSIQINGSTTYAYNANDPISFYKRLWLFNNYDGTDDTTGALYSADAYTGSIITKYPGGAYKDIKACTFFDVPRYVFNKNVPKSTIDPKYNSICYIKGTNLIFLNPDDLSSSYASMTMDNIEADQATNITVYDLAIEGTNIYRLQRKATYYGTTALFADSTYNYQLSSLNSFITSISLRADPAILPANGINPATITAIVKDQFNLPVQQKQVFFTDDDPNGSILSSPVNTDANGVAQTTYIAGITAREVRITSTAQQG